MYLIRVPGLPVRFGTQATHSVIIAVYPSILKWMRILKLCIFVDSIWDPLRYVFSCLLYLKLRRRIVEQLYHDSQAQVEMRNAIYYNNDIELL